MELFLLLRGEEFAEADTLWWLFLLRAEAARERESPASVASHNEKPGDHSPLRSMSTSAAGTGVSKAKEESAMTAGTT